MVFLQRFRCTTEPIGGGTEYDEEGELVSWEAAVAAIEIAKKQLGWHPASELPQVDKKTGLSDEVIAIQDRFCDGERVIYTRIVGSGWKHDNIKWWCYPPNEDKK